MSTAPASPDDPGTSKLPPSAIESVDNALRLLLLFAERPRVRLTDVSTYLGVAASTAHRLLTTLQHRGFVRQDAVSRAYEPGSALTMIAAATQQRVDVRVRARPILERLHATYDETVHLGRLDGSVVEFLDSIESTRAVRVGSRTGRSLPAHCTSTGKAMLSTLSTEELHRRYPDTELEALTARTITSRDVLERELATARRRGYATSMQESEDGVASVAVPVVGPNGALFALNISMPTIRMPAAVRTRIAAALQEAAAELTELLR
ncbi:transcriptional regulator, IclR family [Pseudonocardia thermophila]|uniref:Glycerol operon regulatory protein n=1 Tax=Pseudonocardia thermophila TaxID=1848 RepID=A0A1M6XKJ5_PSETH|nr:IclR family transcriptional regulator [Pseudonocardia thermophila]SHL06522.1 transcriptional regulator, IclR family [Pseudonocardia thermophila]